MNKYTNFIGIDVSKDTFDIYLYGGNHRKFNNDTKGIKKFISTIPNGTHVTMEATGSYHQRLAIYLYDHDIKVSIVNPLSVKRFIQMKLKKNKTDKSDAKMITLYGKEQSPSLWKPNMAYVDTSKDIQTTIGLYLKQQTSYKNKLHSLESKGIAKGSLVRSLNRQLKTTIIEIKKMESEMEQLIKENDREMFTNICSIPGIGKKTAMLLISSTNAFATFDDHRQVIAYIGLAPQHYSSGTSVHLKSRITKTGNARVRNHLFLCSFTASVHNPTCRALYERILNKGKSKKLALIAVCNKLIKQSFAIAKSGIPYDKNYKSRLSAK